MISVKKIVITGPESSGKTTLAQQLATHYATQWVPEYARSYLEQLGRPYHQEDLLAIARGQATAEDRKKLEAVQYLFCDTGLEVIKIWSMVKYGKIDQRLKHLLDNHSYSAYLLCRPDLDWAPDPLRETPKLEDRLELFELYEKELHQSRIPWITISGRNETRLQLAVEGIEAQFA